MNHNKRILVVDDDAAILSAVKMMLEDEGYAVDTSISAPKLENISQNRPDMLVLDIWLSGTDGRDICKSLKSQDTTKNIPVILFSANKDIQQMAQEAGADDFLLKPFDIDDLINKVEHYAP